MSQKNITQKSRRRYDIVLPFLFLPAVPGFPSTEQIMWTVVFSLSLRLIECYLGWYSPRQLILSRLMLFTKYAASAHTLLTALSVHDINRYL